MIGSINFGTLSWVVWSLRCSALLLGGYVAWKIWKSEWPGWSLNWLRLPATLTGKWPRRVIDAGLLLGLVGCCYSLGHHAGYTEGQWALLRNRYTYTDVLITAKQGSQDFTLQPARMEPWQAHLCSAVDWQVGQQMQVLTYQQRESPHCKDVQAVGSYVFYTYKGKRINYREETRNAGY